MRVVGEVISASHANHWIHEIFATRKKDGFLRPVSLLGAISALFLMFASALTFAQDVSGNKPLVYAGYAFAGNYDNRESLYPFSSALIEKTPGFIDILMLEKLRTRPELLKRLSLDKADIKQDLTSVACALVQENVEIQRIDGKYLVVVLMQANVLGFNRASNSVVASHPLRMRFSRMRDSEPSRSELQTIVEEAYTSTNPAENLLDQWLIKLEKARFKAGATKYLRVSDIGVDPEAEDVLKQSGVNLAAFKNRTANLLEASLSENSGVPIVPNTVGETIGNKMAMRFASAEAFSIALPDPDYAVSFVVRGFASKTTEGAGSFTDIYRAKGTLTIKLPDTGKTFIDEQLYDTRFVVRPKNSLVQFSTWDQYNKTLQQLIFVLGKQLVSTEDEWLKEHAARKTDAKAAFLQVKQLFQEL